MPLIRPLRALRYGSDVDAPLGELVSPATVGEPADRTVVGDVHEHNIRQLVRGDRGPLATEDEADFTHAARLLDHWKQDGILVRDPRPAMYVYGQRLDGVERMGLVCLVRLADYDEGIILPHEKTRGGSTEALHAQLSATDAQFSMVMAVVPDEQGVLAELLTGDPGRPMMVADDGKGRTNAVWRIEEPATHLELIESLRDEIAVIADGHHRYEAALWNRAQRGEGDSGRREHPWNYTMMLLVPASEPGLRSRPSHRICPELPSGAETLLAELEAWFDASEFEDDDALMAALEAPGGVRFGMVGSGRRTLLELHAGVELPPSVPETLRGVDAAVLEALVLDRLDSADSASGSPWGHNASDADTIMTAAAAGEIDLAFLLRPVPPAQVIEVARAGGLMPPKSTNFAPKPAKGFLIASLKSF
ncbi:MAG: DUF1015 domain-containing protein [Proteobacteria bacterium]|nr:DUF1015 domain-containing protein [Pseudomonadota bacterium]